MLQIIFGDRKSINELRDGAPRKSVRRVDRHEIEAILQDELIALPPLAA
ncbi:hypothetical protein [Palleronia sp. LCG004]|nr:hypothetical protein [Palleronia sp. LCG004]WOI55562.1 hypothetical protein RVY76_10975 [Palleronia sp. LCG004]